MRKNFKKNIVGIMLAFIAILMPINAFAASSANIYSGGRVSFPASVTGYSNLNGYDHFEFFGTASVFYSDGYEGVYCMSPFMATPDLGTLGITSTGLSDTDNKKLGAGLDYIKKNYGGDFGKKAEKYFVWWFLSGKAAYKGSVAYTLSSMSFSDGSKASLDKVWYEAVAYSDSNYTKYTAESYCTDVQPGNKQPLILINYREAVGYVKVKKTTASNKHLTDLCPEQYSNAGAEFLLTNRADGTQVNLTTNENGESEIKQTIAGTYGVTETKAPKGHKINRNIPDITIKPGETTEFTVADEPLFDPLSLKIQKKAESGADKNLSLEGAEYTVKYYKDFLTKEQIEAGAEPFRSWTFRTDKNGEFFIKPKYFVGGDELFMNNKNIPVGLHGAYAVFETKAPKGFAKTEGIISLQYVKPNSTSDQVVLMKDVTAEEKTQKVNIQLQKIDAETGKALPQGYGSFKNAEFSVWHFDPLLGEDTKVGNVVTDDKGFGSLDAQKAGLYTLIEEKAPAGYLKTGKKIKVEARIKEINTAFFDYKTEIPEKPINVKITKSSIGEKEVK